MKTCRTCKIEKELTEYGKYTIRGVVRTRNECKPCRVINVTLIYKSRPDIREKANIAARKSHLKKYGLTVEDFDNMVLAQDSKCAICEEKCDKLNIDHCHKTGKVRGLLCWNCNTAIGKMKDNVDSFKRAIKYLSVGI